MCDNERPQTITRQVLTELLAGGTLRWLDHGRHNHISTLHVKDDLTALPVLHNDTHALRFRGEWEVLQHIVLFYFTARILKFDEELFSFHEFHVKGLSELHQRDLIGT